MIQGITLLFGMPRSGTTWIAKIFDSHPDTLYRHEPDSGGTLNRIPFFPDANQWQAHQRAVEDFVRRLPAMNCSRVAGSLPIFRKNYCSGLRFFFHRAAAIATLAAEPLVRQLPFPTFSNDHRANPPHLVWKSVESVGRLGLIARAIPRSRALLILRHPCAYIASVLSGESQQRFGDAAPASEDYEILEWLLAASPHKSDNPTLGTMKKLTPVERLAWRWLLSNDKALADIKDRDNGTYVRYEDVCAEPFAKAREMLAFAGLPWDPQVKTFIRRSTSQHSNRYYSVFKDPAVAANKWQTELPRESIELVLKMLRGSSLHRLYADHGSNGKSAYAPGINSETALSPL